MPSNSSARKPSNSAGTDPATDALDAATQGRRQYNSPAVRYRGNRHVPGSEATPSCDILSWVSIIIAAIVAGASVLLWLSTRRLVKGAEETAERQLRAYIGHGPNGAHFETHGYRTVDGVREGNPVGPVKYFERNFGKTPARNVAMFVKVKDGLEAPKSFDGDLPRMDVMQTIYPGQNIGKIVDSSKKRGQDFFLWGYITYRDIFGKKWKRRFAFVHHARQDYVVSTIWPDDQWVAHGEHN
ncbi:MAG TPA: hypothetical protein VI113_06565, partial [Alphaproteobacteria bacterium]